MTSHRRIRLQIPESSRELGISVLVDLGFEGFQEEDDYLDAWIKDDRYTADVRNSLEKWLKSHPGKYHLLDEETVAERNWNEEWEKSIKPMQIGPFYLHPTWNTELPPDNTIPIAIDPKMAFGTGYHETTRLILRLIPETVRKQGRVLDMGAGTGILAIAALKSGAKNATAIDIDPWSYENARENAKINGLSHRMEVRIGSVEQLKPGESFDLILANINRNILLDLGDTLIQHLSKGGFLLLSGILEEDEPVILDHASYRLLENKFRLQENEWVVLGLQRKSDH